MPNTLPYTARPDFGFYLSFQDPNDNAVTPTYIDFTTLLRNTGALGRGEQYELGQTLAADPTVILRDVQEYLNSANTSSPYYPNVDAYRRMLWMGTWPNTTVGNLFNANYWGTVGTVDPNLGPRDPSFESYTLGQTVPWISPFATAPVVGSTTPHTGTRDLAYTVVGSTTQQGIVFGMRCMPGRYYTISVWLRQSTGSTQQIFVDAMPGGATVSTGAYVQLSETFLATKPEHLCFVLTTGTAVAGAVLIDDIQMEQQPALNSNITFQFGADKWTTTGATTVRSTLYAYAPEYSLKLTPDGVTVAPNIESVKAAAVPGQVVTASGWVYSPTGTAGKTCDVHVNWYNAGGGLISAPAGTPVVIAANTWTFITTTFTAPALTASVSVSAVINATPAAGNIIYWDLVQVVSTTPTAFTTTGPTVYPIMANFSERYEKLWLDNEYTGYVQIPCVDAITALSATKISSEYVEAVSALAPDYAWTLDNTTSGVSYVDTSGNQRASLTPVVSKYGPGVAPAPGALLNVIGDPGAPGVQFTPAGSNNTATQAATIIGSGLGGAYGSATAAPLPLNTAGTSYGVSVACWIQAANPLTIGDIMIEFFNRTTNLASIQLGLFAGANAGQPYCRTDGANGGGGFTATPITSVCDGKPHLVVGTVSVAAAGNTVYTVYVDSGIGGNTASGTATTASLGGAVTGAQTVNVGGQMRLPTVGSTGFTSGPLVNGILSHVYAWNRVLSAAEVTQLWTAGGLGYSGELAGTRISRHFVYGGYPAPYRISATTTSVMGPPSFLGLIDLTSDTQNTVAAEGGRFWIAPDGAPVVESRQDRWLRLTPTWTIGNTVPGNPHFREPSYSVDPQYVYANVQVTRNGGGTAIGGLPADITAALKRYFGRTYTASVDLQTDAATQDMANWTFYTHNRTLQRIAALSFSPSADPTLWPFVLGVEIGHRVRNVFFMPAGNGGAGLTVTQDFFVENVTHNEYDADAAEWTSTVLMSPIAGAAGGLTMQPFILDNATYGVLDQNILGW